MTAHVARKGEPEEKTSTTANVVSTTNTNLTKCYDQPNNLHYGAKVPEATTLRTSASPIKDNTFRLI